MCRIISRLLYPFFVIGSLVLSSCSKYYCFVQEKIEDDRLLASTFTAAPHIQSEKKEGVLIVSWYVPEKLVDQTGELLLQVRTKEYQYLEKKFPIETRRGTEVVEIGAGIMSYKATLSFPHSSQTYSDTHALWVERFITPLHPKKSLAP